ncbi:MAG TPA: uroporphyrinogen decarboxylase [bacterium]|nr:uroporphyrinogen decarboxylase [bacterium]
MASFESRMAKEMEELIRRNGGIPRVAPSMREIPLTDNPQAFEFFERLQAGGFDLLVLLTGVGTRALLEALGARYPLEEVLAPFKRVSIAVRGPKPVQALGVFGLRPDWVAPEPNTWRELLSLLDAQRPVKGLRVAVQEYGVSNAAFLEALRDRGAAEVVSVPVYRWALPEDTAPLVQLLDTIRSGGAQVALFTSANQVHTIFQLEREQGREAELKEAFQHMVVGSVGPVASETLESYGIRVDLEPSHPKMGFLVKELAAKSAELLDEKARHFLSAPRPRRDPLADSLFLKACRREPVDRTPLWIMRQAGRYLPQYRSVRAKVSFLELCKTPELAAEVTVTAQETLGVDAAILFADILLIAEPLGFKLEFAPSGGPVIRNPFRSASDLKRLRPVDPSTDLAYVLQAVSLIRSQLQPGIPLIGFAGAPFTLASYLIEGGGSKDHARVKALLGDEAAWSGLMDRLVTATTAYLTAQAAAGAQALQLFDSWVGILTPEQFQTRVLPYLKKLIAGLPAGVPVIYFGTQTAPLFPWIKETGATVVGVDWRMPLDEAWKRLEGLAVQGNLDPEVLLTDPATVRRETEKILTLAAGRPGHIFNLGHGILPHTPLENVRAMIETVKAHPTRPKG